MRIGIDMVGIDRMAIILNKEPIMKRLFTIYELEIINKAPQIKKSRIAAEIFASKEAVVKAFGTGFDLEMRPNCIEIRLSRNEENYVRFLGSAKKTVEMLGIKMVRLSTDSTCKMAVACVIVE